MMESKQLQSKVNILITCVIVLTLAVAWLAYARINADMSEEIEELTVKRINLVGEDGSLRMVISNEDRQHPGRLNGKDLPPRERPAGIIFFDDYGNECGGLIFNEQQDGEKVYKMMSFTMDNYKNDQAIQLLNEEQYDGDDAQIRRGYIINEFPVGGDLSALVRQLDSSNKIEDTLVRREAKASLFAREGSKRRVFMGMQQDQVGLFLYDKEGKPKLKIYVDEAGEPVIATVDEQGHSSVIRAGSEK